MQKITWGVICFTICTAAWWVAAAHQSPTGEQQSTGVHGAAAGC